MPGTRSRTEHRAHWGRRSAKSFFPPRSILEAYTAETDAMKRASASSGVNNPNSASSHALAKASGVIVSCTTPSDESREEARVSHHSVPALVFLFFGHVTV